MRKLLLILPGLLALLSYATSEAKCGVPYPGPEGAIGPTGAQGPTGPTGQYEVTFASAYNDSSYVITPDDYNDPVLLSFPSTTFTPVGIDHSDPTSFVVSNSAYYFVEWTIGFLEYPPITNVALYLIKNGNDYENPFPFESLSTVFIVKGSYELSGSAIIFLNAGDEISLGLKIQNITAITLSTFSMIQLNE